MEGISGHVNSAGASLHYLKFGAGPDTWLCFHGFGQAATAFEFLGEQLGNQCTFFCFDLFYHGKSTWNKGENIAISKEEFISLILEFKKKEGVASLSLLGMSLGAMAALSCLEFFAGDVKKVLLLAPQGINRQGLYHFITGSLFLRKLFKLTIEHPGVIVNFLKLANKIPGLSHRQVKGLIFLMKSTSFRESIYPFWMVMRGLRVESHKINRLILTENIALTWVFGKKDIISQVSSCKKFLPDSKLQEVFFIESGHWDFLSVFSVALKTGQLKNIFT